MLAPFWTPRMTFRTANLPDASALAAISIEVWLGTYMRNGVSPFFAQFALNEFTPAKLETLIQDADEHVIVSENEDGLDGFIRVSRAETALVKECSTTRISTLYVRPRKQGRGVGSALLEHALNFAQASGDASVWLTVNSENTSALRFYLKHGFENVGTTQYAIKGRTYPNEVLSRYLLPPFSDRQTL